MKLGASLEAQKEKNQPAMQETQVRSLGLEDALEKETATHPRILAWSVPRTAEPGGLQSAGSQTLGRERAVTTVTCRTRRAKCAVSDSSRIRPDAVRPPPPRAAAPERPRGLTTADSTTDGGSKGRHASAPTTRYPAERAGKSSFQKSFQSQGPLGALVPVHFLLKDSCPSSVGEIIFWLIPKSYHLPESLWVPPGLPGGISSDQDAQSVPYLLGRP